MGIRMRKKSKVVYKDDRTTKVLFGEILEEDTFFIKIKVADGNIFRLNKSHIISIKEFEK
jgi:hypothetical protein